MSTFAVTREIIGEIKPIEGADRIEVATLAGMDFQFVVGKGSYKPGDPVLYIPVDSILPGALIERLGLQGKLAGQEQNRVKTVVLRGAYSQGVVASPDIVPDTLTDPAEITSHLGITKWEPVPNEVADGILLPRPDGLSKYDIESADRYTGVAHRLMDRAVFVTEKLEGANAWASAMRGEDVLFGMRDNVIHAKPDVENSFHRVLRDHDVGEFARSLASNQSLRQRVTVYGEFIGPGSGVKNYYGLKVGALYLFDIRVGHTFLPAEEFLAAVERFYGGTDMVVPMLQKPDGTTLRKWLAGRSIKKASDGKSMLVPKKRREGIVIKPVFEDRDPAFGRLVLKQRSPAYLAKTGL